MSPAAESNWRILCIDDEPDVLEILRTALGLKYEVVTANNGIEAIGLLDYCDADFVICDVRMPKMDGFQTVEAIRRHPDYMAVPVFFLTAETGREMAQRGFAAGANLYLTKPFDPMRVLQNIEYFLEQGGCTPRAKRMSTDEVARHATTPDTPEPTATPVEAAAEPRVIIMGSRPEQIRNVHDALRSRCECIVCADPLASLHQIFSYEPDVLVINPAIPKLSGWGLVQLIHQNPRLHRLPIVLLGDPQTEFDDRLVPSITEFPPLPPNPSESQVVSTLEDVFAQPDFTPRAKSATLPQLLEHEKEIAARMELETARRRRMEATERERFQSIQTFIDKNFR